MNTASPSNLQQLAACLKKNNPKHLPIFETIRIQELLTLKAVGWGWDVIAILLIDVTAWYPISHSKVELLCCSSRVHTGILGNGRFSVHFLAFCPHANGFRWPKTEPLTNSFQGEDFSPNRTVYVLTWRQGKRSFCFEMSECVLCPCCQHGTALFSAKADVA